MTEKKRRKKSEPKVDALYAGLPSYERFEALTKQLVRVPKEEVDEKRAEQEREKKRGG